MIIYMYLLLIDTGFFFVTVITIKYNRIYFTVCIPQYVINYGIFFLRGIIVRKQHSTITCEFYRLLELSCILIIYFLIRYTYIFYNYHYNDFFFVYFNGHILQRLTL